MKYKVYIPGVTSPDNSAKLHNDAMKLAAQKKEYQWLPLLTRNATFWQTFGVAFKSTMVVSTTLSTTVLTSTNTNVQSESQLLQ